jgi:hypothetical protein
MPGAVRPQGADCTWHGFYRGFGWFCTVSLVFSAWLAWHLGGAAERERPALMPVAWGLFLCQAATLPIVWIYFFPAPIVFATLITALLGVGCALQWRRVPAAAGAE